MPNKNKLKEVKKTVKVCDDSESATLVDPTTHGQPIADCRIGILAMIHVKYMEGEGTGVEVMKVRDFVVDKDDELLYYLTGEMHGPGSMKSTDVKCLTGTWNSRNVTESHKSWSVLAFFEKFNAGRKLPLLVQQKILEANDCGEDDDTEVVFDDGDDVTAISSSDSEPEHQDETKRHPYIYTYI
jgi:hypothetical protein